MKNDGKNGSYDDFWEIDRLLPPRKKSTSPRPPRQIEAAEITAPPQGAVASAPDDRLTVSPTAAHDASASPRPVETVFPNIPQNGASFTEVYISKAPNGDVPLLERPVSPLSAPPAEKEPPLLRYQPPSGLIHEVRVYPWKNQYNYYEQFCRFARRYANVEGTECPEMEFFSYMPQYSQMNRAQLSYYFWWRTNFKKGICLHASYAYLLLFLYELINLDDQINPQTGQEYMVRLWLSYREHHPRLDVLIREWLCDYSLLHRLPAPRLPEEKMQDLIAGARLKEFYVSAAEGEEAFSDAVLYFCSNYDYRKSKFYKPETAALFRRVLHGAVQVALRHQQEKIDENAARQRGYSTVGRDAYSGAICSYRLKRHIEVDFSSFSHTHELRFVVTDVLKYAENALRAALGIKSRLTVYEVSSELRLLLDAYLHEAVPARAPKRSEPKKEEIPEYERRYELPHTALSLSKAAEIEERSWQTTKRLVEAFEPQQEMTENSEKSAPFVGIMPKSVPDAVCAAPTPTPPSVPIPTPEKAAPDGLAAALGELAGFLPLALRGDRAAQRAFAAARGMMVDAVADQINTLAEELLSDIVLEDAGGYYTVIEDYTQFLKDEGVL